MKLTRDAVQNNWVDMQMQSFQHYLTYVSLAMFYLILCIFRRP